MGASLSSMEELFIQQGKTALEILCLNGNLEVLTYYLPIYLKNNLTVIQQSEEESVSVDFQKSTLVETKLAHAH